MRWKADGKQKTNKWSEKREQCTMYGSSTPLYFCDTDAEFALGTRPIWRRFWVLLRRFRHRDCDREVDACVCWRASEKQPALGVIPGSRPCDVALDVLLGHTDGRGGRIRVYKRR
jgi:hypothetical protein